MASTLRNIWAITVKELRSYFVSPVAWVMMGLFAAIFGVFYVAHLNAFVAQSMQSQFGGAAPNLNVNQHLIRGVLANASVLVLFILPMVTMRTYAEEKRSGTVELLLTSPLTDFEIIMGKFLGAVCLYAALIAVTFVHVGLLFHYGQPDWRPLVAGYLGLLLQGSSFIAAGLFFSSTTKNQMAAGAATFVVLLVFWIIGWFADSAGPTMAAILNNLSITQHFDDFAKGVIDTKHLIFYLSFITFWLFLTVKSLDTERWRG
ncbi:MAG: ABC transporter permease [Acidobacteriota bacterium]